ncbi:trascriptional regulator [Bacillus sp. FJAT-25509]|nr:trascriptional regulator [Bacillus sp. FJAT-25509]
MKKEQVIVTWKKILLRFGLTLMGLVVVAGLTGLFIYHQVESTGKVIYQPIKKTTKRSEPVSVVKKDPFSILLLGVDKREGDRGRSDSLMVLTVNPNTNTTKIISIPRDTRTLIDGKNKVDKINHAYAFGGVQMSINTVEKFLNIPIDYYMEVNMEGFKDVVDAIGGVKVDNGLDFWNDGVHFKKGSISLDGEDALSFTRMRHDDPRGDFGREERQRQIIEAVIHQGARIENLIAYNDILKSIQNNLVTNFTLQEMYKIQKDYRQAGGNVEQEQLQGSGEMIKGIYYYQVPEKNRLALSNELRTQLELK